MVNIHTDFDKNDYLKKVDSTYGFTIAKNLLKFRTRADGFRNAGTLAEREAAELLALQMKEIGLADVTVEGFDVDKWEFHDATVEISKPGVSLIHAGSFSGLDGTGPDGITGQLVYVGEGTAKDYEGLDVEGKIVLIDTDAYYTYWYNLLFEEAQARGAKAAIAAVTDRGPGTYKENLITIQNIQGFVDIPAIMLNKRDSILLREAAKNDRELKVTVNVDVETSCGAEAHYVHGRIKGNNPESIILLSAHYDAYWEGFLDNASACGTVMTIAKAMLESGYNPDSTIIFVMNGAEEYGRKGSAFDYCVGATAIARQHPEWIDNAKACFNFELTAHSQVEKFSVTVTAGYEKWFSKLLEQTGLIDNYSVIPTSMSGADHIVFTKAGAPTCMNISTCFNGDDPESASNYDHTQYDNPDRYDATAFDEVNKVYGLLGILIDSTSVIELDIEPYIKDFWEGIDIDTISSLYRDVHKIDALLREINSLTETIRSKHVEKHITDWDISRTLLEINRLFTKDIYKYNAFTELIIGHMQPYMYVKVLSTLIDNLKTGSTEGIDAVLELDNNYLITAFSRDVYEKTVIRSYEKDVPQEWGEGNTIPFPDLYDVVKSVINKQKSGNCIFDEEIDLLNTIVKEQQQLLCDLLDTEMKTLCSVKSKAESLLE